MSHIVQPGGLAGMDDDIDEKWITVPAALARR